MKKMIFTVVLATLLLGVIPATVSAGVWIMTWVDPHREFAAHVNADINKIEGLLHAYSINKRNDNVKEQIFAASDDLSASLKILNADIEQSFPSLNKEEQLTLIDAYLLLGSYLDELAVKTNSVFGKKVFGITDGNEIDGGVVYGIPGLVWDCSRGLDW